MRGPGVALGLILLTLAAGCGPADAPPVLREVRLVMGTTAEVRAGGLDDARAAGAIERAFQALEDVEARLSLWRESELLALNRAGAGTVSPATFQALAHALEMAEASGGAFDPTVEPLVRALGGFGQEARALDDAARREILGRVDFHLVSLDQASRAVRLDGDARLVLDALAKGDGADRALAALRVAGAEDALVDLGGSTLAVFGVPLTVDLRDPTGERRPWGAFVLDDAALGSSGADQQQGHILDPRTGEPARRVLQATVVAESAREADALSTAVFVLGAAEGLSLVARRGAAGLVLAREEGERRIHTTRGFAAAHALKAAPGVAVQEAPS